MSLVYYGGEDEDAFKHKIVYVPEAAVIAEKNKVESPLTIMLRILICEGRLDHNVALPQADGPHETMHIKRNGPVVVVITSARDNVEDEMLTRLMTSDADESAQQTVNVVLGRHSDGGAARRAKRRSSNGSTSSAGSRSKRPTRSPSRSAKPSPKPSKNTGKG